MSLSIQELKQRRQRRSLGVSNDEDVQEPREEQKDSKTDNNNEKSTDDKNQSNSNDAEINNTTNNTSTTNDKDNSNNNDSNSSKESDAAAATGDDDNKEADDDNNDTTKKNGAEPAAAPATPQPESDGVMAAEFAVLHPLEFEWSFWFDKRQVNGRRQKGEMAHYETNLRSIGNFGTVEDFWRYFHHIVKPTEMEVNANCHLFKTGIKPMWEDPTNAGGGKWVAVFRGDRSILDQIWENVVLSMIGETFGVDSNEICGAVCSRRKKGDKIAVWNRSKNDEAAIMQIGHTFKQLLGASGGHMQLTYQWHEDALRSTTSYSNPVRYKL